MGQQTQSIFSSANLESASKTADRLTKPPTGAGIDGAGIQWIWEHAILPPIIDPLGRAKANGTLTIQMCQQAIVDVQAARLQVTQFLQTYFPTNPSSVQHFRDWLNSFSDTLIRDRNDEIVSLGGSTVDVTTLTTSEGGVVTLTPPATGGVLDTIGGVVTGQKTTPVQSTVDIGTGGQKAAIANTNKTPVTLGPTNTDTLFPSLGGSATRQWLIIGGIAVAVILALVLFLRKKGR